jgi:hypothetical protein
MTLLHSFCLTSYPSFHTQRLDRAFFGASKDIALDGHAGFGVFRMIPFGSRITVFILDWRWFIPIALVPSSSRAYRPYIATMIFVKIGFVLPLCIYG